MNNQPEDNIIELSKLQREIEEEFLTNPSSVKHAYDKRCNQYANSIEWALDRIMGV